MDSVQFDRLARSLARTTSRRTTLIGLVGGLLARLGRIEAAAADPAWPRRRNKGRQPNRETGQGNGAGTRNHAKRAAASDSRAKACCASGSCTAGPGKNLTKCCYEGQSLAGTTFRGVNATRASFRGATLTNADFRGANLSGACFVDADIQGAKFGGANLQGVIRCRTQTGAGIDNSGCSKGTACCPTELGGPCTPTCTGRECGPDGCGGSCGTCPAGEACNATGVCICTPQSCPDGCCDASQACQPGNTNQVCGSGGTRCLRCAAGQVCQDQQCVCAPSCTGKLCGPDGCGGTCGSCQSGQRCTAGGQCVCDAQSCSTGCCDTNQICQPGTTRQNCGSSGGSCGSCSLDQGCQNGQCVSCRNTFDCPCLGQSTCTDENGPVFCRLLDGGGVCTCMVSVEGQPICTGAQARTGCMVDADCQQFGADAVCIANVSGSDQCDFGENFCTTPCPAH